MKHLQPTPTERLLVGLSRLEPSAGGLSGLPASSLERVDWEELADRAAEEGVSPLLYRNLKGRKGDVPAHVLDKLKKDYFGNELRNIRIYQKLAPFLDGVRRAGLRIALTKGGRLALTVYPDIGLRAFTDIDLIVHPEDWPGLRKILSESGFIPPPHPPGDIDPKDSSLHWTFSPYYRLDSLVIELHFAGLGLHLPFHSEKDFWNSMGSVKTGESEARILSPEYELCYLCLHAQQHSYGRLMWLTDIAELVSQGKLDVAKLGEIGRREGISAMVRHGLLLVETLWPGSVPLCLLGALPASAFEERLLRFFWPLDTASSRRGGFVFPYYTTTMFALWARKRPLLAARALFLILFPPKTWMMESYGIRPGSLRLYVQYAARIADPMIRAMKKSMRGSR